MTDERMRIRPGQRGYKQWQKKNSPPAGEPWIWLTREMLESSAWGALPAPSKRVIERLLLEHMAHAGTDNGELSVTYDDFERFGVSRKSIKTAIYIARALGFIDVTYKGIRSHGSARRPSKYALTWLPQNDGSDATNRWKAIKSKERADEIVDAVRNKEQPCKGDGSDVPAEG